MPLKYIQVHKKNSATSLDASLKLRFLKDLKNCI